MEYGPWPLTHICIELGPTHVLIRHSAQIDFTTESRVPPN